MRRTMKVFVTGTSSSQDRNCADDGEEDAWSVWGRVANDWETTYKKKTAFVKVILDIYTCIIIRLILFCVMWLRIQATAQV